MLQDWREAAREGWLDIDEALHSSHRTMLLGWQEIATRYHRSRIGPFWLTINKAVLIAVLSFVFGALFGLDTDYFIPFLAIGLIVWAFISAVLGDACLAFSGSATTILHVRMPLFTHVGVMLYRNLLILAHNAVIIPLVLLLMLRPVGVDVLLVIPGLVLLCLNLAWMALILAVVCARFRDVTEIMANALQVLFYLTPIIWTTELLQGRVNIVWIYLNPLYHLLEVVRAPLLGDSVSVVTWLATAAMAVLGWAVALPFFGRYRHRVPYWL
jgi:ABC-type polysaccharide/polyol phosphate export permease